MDFMVDNAQLGFLGEHRAPGGLRGSQTLGGGGQADPGLCSPVSDRDRNLMVYMYLPEGEYAPLPHTPTGLALGGQ